MFAQESVMDIQKEKKAIKNLKAFYMEDWNLTEEECDDLDNLVSRIVAVVKTEAQAVPEWISVADEMPPVEQTVLVCWDYAPDIEPDKEYTTTDEDLNEYWPNCQDEPPTHWMPLPRVIKAQEPTND